MTSGHINVTQDTRQSVAGSVAHQFAVGSLRVAIVLRARPVVAQPCGKGVSHRSRKSAAAWRTALSSSRTCGLAVMYVWISERIWSLFLPLRPVKNAFTSG